MEVSWICLLILTGILLGAGTYLLWRVMTRARALRRLNEFFSPSEGEPPLQPEPALATSLFEQPCRWLAIRGEHPQAVQEALHLRHAMPCSWMEGLVEAQEDKLFIAPPISGWILVVGSGLPDPFDDIDKCFHFLADLSRKLGAVQLFNINRVLNHHAWASFEKGRALRAYAWAEKTLWNQGAMTPAERELEMRCFDYANELIYLQREALGANLEKIPQLAARWSIDPGSISDPNWSATNGIVGQIPHSRPQ